MKKSSKYLKIIVEITIILMIISSSNILSIGNAQINNLKVESSTTQLIAESENNVTLTIFNDFEPIYELHVSVSFPASIQNPSSPNLIGAHNWKFEKVEKGDNMNIQLIVFVPEDAAGQAYTANIILTYKRLGYISPYTETHNLGFYAQGWIDINLYEFEVEPNPVQPGESITFSANVLNKGNIPAMFMNISLSENENLILQSESYSYLGQVDPNSPAPFTLEAIVNSITSEGNYSAVILVSYEDNNNVVNIVTRQVQYNVFELKVEETPKGPIENIMEYVTNYRSPQFIFPLIIILVIIISISILVRKRRSKLEEFEV